MGWEERNGHAYYYRKRWEDGRCTSEYVGGGVSAEYAALIDAIDRCSDAQAREAEQAVLRDLAEHHAAMDAPIGEFSSMLQRLTSAVLLVNGYKKHKGTWRRRRGRTTE